MGQNLNLDEVVFVAHLRVAVPSAAADATTVVVAVVVVVAVLAAVEASYSC